MRHSLLLLHALAVSLASATAPPPVQGDRNTPLALFRDDVRLQAKVTLRVSDQPLAEVVSTLARDLRLSLRAAPSVSDDKATLFLDGRPGAEVLSLIARHFDFEWRRTGAGYELYQPGAGRDREAARRQADLDAEWTELRDWIDRLARLTGTPKAELESRSKQITQQLGRPELQPAERERRRWEQAAAAEALKPMTAAAVPLLRSLTLEQVARLRAGEDLLLSARNGGIPAAALEIAGQVADGDPKGFVDVVTLPVFADGWIRLWRRDTPAGDFPPLDRRTALMLELTVRRDLDGKRQWSSVQWMPQLPPRETREPAPTATNDPALTRLVELTLPVRRAAGPPRERDDILAAQERRSWPALPRLSEIAGVLHEATGLEIVADSFVRARLRPERLSGRHSVARLLDRIAADLDYTWSLEGNVVRLRSRSYYHDRPMEVPDRIRLPWQARIGRTGAVTLDDLAGLATALTDEQTRGMGHYWGWYLEEPWIAPPPGGSVMLHAQRRHLRFWASLAAAQRQQALAGTLLPVATMGAPQSRAFATALADPRALISEPGAEFLLSRRALTPAELRTGGFRLKVEDKWRMQACVGIGGDGKTTTIVVRYPSYRQPILSRLPDQFQWSTIGAPARIDTCAFLYYLGGDEQPARTVEIEVAAAPGSR